MEKQTQSNDIFGKQLVLCLWKLCCNVIIYLISSTIFSVSIKQKSALMCSMTPTKQYTLILGAENILHVVMEYRSGTQLGAAFTQARF